MIVEMGDVIKCLETLESGKDFVFIFEKDRLRPYRDEDDNISDLAIMLTPEWYDLCFCSNDWDERVLKNELVDFHLTMKKLNEEFISTKFTVVWR